MVGDVIWSPINYIFPLFILGNDFQTLSEFVAILDKNRTRTVPNITVAASGDSSASSVSLMSTSSASSTLAIGV